MEENGNLPSPDITPCMQSESSVRESINNEIKDETIELYENLQAENSIEETEIGTQHNLDIDITKIEEVIKGYMKNDDSGFKEEYEVGIAIFFFFKMWYHYVHPILFSYIFISVVSENLNLKEFLVLQKISYGERYSCENGKLPENIPKNRFKTICPCTYTYRLPQ